MIVPHCLCLRAWLFEQGKADEVRILEICWNPSRDRRFSFEAYFQKAVYATATQNPDLKMRYQTSISMLKSKYIPSLLPLSSRV